MRALRSASAVMVANIVEVATVLVRNMLLARLLSVEQFGLAATFSIMMMLTETFQNVGLNRMIVQDRRAEDPFFLNALHGVQILTAVGASAALVLLAWPYALAMATPALVGAYLLVALIPLINGFVNLETFRVQRDGRFAPQAIRSVLSQPIGLLAVFPGYWWFGDYRAALVSIFAQQASAVLLTHLAVRTSFKVVYDKRIWRSALAFGLPLVLNGILMFLVINGDRVIISREFGPAALGWFSVALLLTMTPANLVAKTLQTVTLPVMAREQDNQQALQYHLDLMTTVGVFLAMAMVAGSVILARPVIVLLYSAKFAPAAAYLPLLAVVHGLRLVRTVPTIAAMARGETKNPLYANVVRGLFIPLALMVAMWTQDIEAMLLVSIAGECVALVWAGWLVHRWVSLSVRYFMQIVLAAAIAMGCMASTPEFGWVAFACSAIPILIILPRMIPVFARAGGLTHASAILRRRHPG